MLGGGLTLSKATPAGPLRAAVWGSVSNGGQSSDGNNNHFFAHTTTSRKLLSFVPDRRKLIYDVLSTIFKKALNTILIIRLVVVPSSSSQSRVDNERSGQRVPTVLAIRDHYECFTNCETLVTATIAYVYLPFKGT